MSTQFEQPHGDTIAYAAMCEFVEAMNTLTDLWNQCFKNLKAGKPIDDGLSAQIKEAEIHLQQTRDRHRATRDWALSDASASLKSVSD